MRDPFELHPDTAAFIAEIRRDKYLQPGEADWSVLHRRVASSLSGDNVGPLYDELQAGRACPAGRVLAGAGTSKNVTWWNCFVASLLQDSMRTDPSRPGLGIMDCLASVAYSMQMGGGVGTDFSPLRPEGALVRRVNAPASGPLAFMDMWDSMCRTIMSAGYRRGAMMATLRDDHPDLMKFITAKHDGARLRMFNVSVLISDAFMKAVEVDGFWELGHWQPPFDRSRVDVVRRKALPGKEQDPTAELRDWFVYEMLPARKIWQTLMESTYKYAEPGVIFIDRVNKLNNLWYCEHIQCTNPCGEQPLPPDQNCNLSHNNLSRFTIGAPFTDECEIDYPALRQTTALLVRMSDNVIDLSPVPTEAQRAEAQAKRRVGLGITGLANALMFLRQRYGSPAAIETTDRIMEEIKIAAYAESINLARERGPFPAFDRDKYLKGEFVRALPEWIQQGIAEQGIRNSLLLTVAPVGTGSIAQCDNASTGLEPVFEARYRRKVLQPDNSFREAIVEDFGFRVYANAMFGGDMDAALGAPLPDYMATTADLIPEDHLLTQAAVQKHVDASVSKTINVPTQFPFTNFVGVYWRAYELGCKGCTTYRPDPDSGRGAVLSSADPVVTDLGSVGAEVKILGLPPLPPPPSLRERPERLPGSTYRLRWSTLPYPFFLTINDEVLPDGTHVPFEVFINSKAVDYSHWVTALTRLISAVMRKGGDLSFLLEELKNVWSARGGEFVDRKFVPSEVALIGLTLERHFREVGYLPAGEVSAASPVEVRMTGVHYAELGIGEECPSCGALQVVRAEGCKRCVACGWSNCG